MIALPMEVKLRGRQGKESTVNHNEKGTKHISVYVKDQTELDILHAQAKMQGKTLSNYVRGRCGMKPLAVGQGRKGIAGLRRKIAAIENMNEAYGLDVPVVVNMGEGREVVIKKSAPLVAVESNTDHLEFSLDESPIETEVSPTEIPKSDAGE